MIDIQCFVILKIKSELVHVLVNLTIIFANFADKKILKPIYQLQR